MEGGKLKILGEKTCHFYETTENFVGSTKMEIFYREKLKSHQEKIKEVTLPTLKNIPVMPLIGR